MSFHLDILLDTF
uniref:Uncharacterized protein n=1 Tax=Rhizophora mucronata TaxID=61149 RepID=A0A2P2NTF0_RHIMU